MIKPQVLIILLSFVVIPQGSLLADIYISLGDIDGFGFSDVSALKSATGGPADRNGNSILDEGDSLPDLNGDGRIDPDGDDFFNNRMVTDPVFTDIGLSFSNSLELAFSFTIPTNETVVDATFYLVTGDASRLNAANHPITIDGLLTGAVVEPRDPFATGDGLITITEVLLSHDLLSCFDDGLVTFGIDYTLFPDDIAIDYARLEIATVPVPGAVLLGMIGLSIAGVKLRKHA